MTESEGIGPQSEDEKHGAGLEDFVISFNLTLPGKRLEQLIRVVKDHDKDLWDAMRPSLSDMLHEIERMSSDESCCETGEKELERLATAVADGSVLIPNITYEWARVKKEGLDATMYGTGSYEGDCKIIDEQRKFFDDLYLLLSKIIDIDPDLLPDKPKEVEHEG